MDSLGQVAEFAALTPTSSIFPEINARTSLILADCIGAIVGGAAEPDVTALASRQAGNGTALLIGTSQKRPPGTAALLNGTAGTTLEMDEGNQFCKGHPGMHTVPAALAAASQLQISGADLLAAIAIGYDVGARVGISTQLRPSMHPHGTWGAICAATAVARLQRASPDQMRHAISLSASLGLSTSRRTMLEGGTVRNVFAGVSGQMGVLAGDMIAAGFTGDHDGVTQVFGNVVSDSFDTASFSDSLGTRWEVSRNYFKMHSCCRYNHAALDALAQLRMRMAGLDDNIVESVVVETYSLAVELDDPSPKNVLAGKFSVPFAVASALVNGSTGVDSFTMPNIVNPRIIALAQRVKVVEDATMTALLPHKRPAKITLTLKSGEVLESATETNRGDWSDPYSEADVRNKYLSLTARLWHKDAAVRVWNKIMALGSAPSLDDVFTEMAQAPR